jgi:hypothetical protein
MAEMPSATLALDCPFISFHRHGRERNGATFT